MYCSCEIVKTEQFTKSCSSGVWPVSQLFVFATCFGPHRFKNCDCFSTRTTGVEPDLITGDGGGDGKNFEPLRGERSDGRLAPADGGEIDIFVLAVLAGRQRFTKDASFSKSVGNNISQ